MDMPELQSFNLVGGTALALKYGHRISIDLDLFTTEDFEHQPIIAALQNKFGEVFRYDGEFSKWGIFCYIENVKIDLVYYPFDMIAPIMTIGKVRLYDDKDLCAMKIQAILGRGKKKDFYDIYELLQQYSLSDIIDFHKTKYPSNRLLIGIPQAIVYFKDADESDNPIILKEISWSDIKYEIQKAVREYLS
ncbi:hypothetical protein FACS189413_03640 [Bacteroidia bacterium]|nr:hypothetical protein FACS189413_03640 [Bacteroidia bacterium]